MLRFLGPLLAATCLLVTQISFAAVLPGGLTSADIDHIVKNMGHGSVTKLLRSAEPYRELWPGIKVGAEVDVMLAGDIATLGDTTGDVPGLVPMPRFYFAKSLPLDLELILSVIPSSITHTVAASGFMLKWSFYNERSRYLSAAAFIGYTGFTGFNGDLFGSSYEVGAYVSKDFVRIRPYLGIATLFTHGEVSSGLAKGTRYDAWQNTLHAFIGLEWGLLPIDIAVQLDFFNLTPRGSFCVGKTF